MHRQPSRTCPFILACLILSVLASPALADSVWLADLGFDKLHQDWGSPGQDKSVDGNPLVINGKTYDHGVGSHGLSIWWIKLGGAAERFTASVGVDDEVKNRNGSADYPVEFRVWGDQTVVWNSGKMKAGDPAQTLDLDVRGVQTLALVIQPMGKGIDFAHGDWADAAITYTGQAPVPIDPIEDPVGILTPAPQPAPRINGAMVLGVRPGHPVLYTIAATGARPIAFEAAGLPAGLSLDPATGQITGSTLQPGRSIVTLKATNPLGAAERKLRIEIGPDIALTPPMGWNSWNCFAKEVSDEKVRAAADAMVSSGLIRHGWTYINVDDCWEVPANQRADLRRNPDGSIRSNPKFPDMKALADFIHSRGLRAGLYSSPGPATCGGFTASYLYEAQDARQYAQWGFDYLKYDWCSYSKIDAELRKQSYGASNLMLLQRPYAIMGDALLKQNRDIVFSLCQYGLGDVWQWGTQVDGNSWRTTSDITDSWSTLQGIGFNQAGHEKFAAPGHWNDPDMLVVGNVGWGPKLHPTGLTQNEQYTHISLWCLLSAPLLIGCDMTQLDDFTSGLLSNDEVLAVDQDPLGKQAGRISADDQGLEIWSKPLEDGSVAVGLFNRGEMPATVTAKWDQLNLSGKQTVRDLWRQKDLGDFEDHFDATVARHGVVLLKITKNNPQ